MIEAAVEEITDARNSKREFTTSSVGLGGEFFELAAAGIGAFDGEFVAVEGLGEFLQVGGAEGF